MKKIILTIVEDKNWEEAPDKCDGFRASKNKKELSLESDDVLPSGLTLEIGEYGDVFKLIIP